MPHPPTKRHPTKRPGAVLAKLAVLAVLLSMLQIADLPGAPQAEAGVITPYVKTEAGYTDNVRFRRDPVVASPFFRITPGFRWQKGQTPHEFDGFVEASYIRYFNATELSNFDGGSLAVNYLYTHSPRFQFYTRVRGTATYNPAEISQTGELITIQEGDGRIDRISVNPGAIYRYGNFDRIEGGYVGSYTTYTDPTQENSLFQEGYLIWSTRMAQVYELTVNTRFTNTTYERTPTVNRARIRADFARLIGPNKRAFVGVGYRATRYESSTEELRTASDYDIVTLGAGYSHQVSPRFDWEISAGYSQVTGDTNFNNAADQGFPVFDLRATYKGPTWSLTGYARADLSEFDTLGNNSGLTSNHMVGTNYNYRLTQRWTLWALAEYTLNNYQQDPNVISSTQRGKVHNYRGQAGLSYQITKRTRLSLEYHHLTRDAEETDDDRSENRIMLRLYTEYPFQW